MAASVRADRSWSFYFFVYIFLMQWAPYVMVRITMVFVIGILSGIFLPDTFPIEGCTVFLVVLSIGYVATRWLLKRHASIRLASGFVGLCFILIAGYLVTVIRDDSRSANSLVQCNDKIFAFRARLDAVAERRENSWRQAAIVTHVETAEGWVACHGRLMLYWRLEEHPDSLTYGTTILVRGEPNSVPGPQNPDEFDYQLYLARRGIHHQCFVQPRHWTVETYGSTRGLLYTSIRARQWIVRTIDAYIPGKQETAIVKAFTVGMTSGIDDDLRQAYSAGGVMHVLAVSGMHVSILYGVLLLLLKPLEKRKGGSWIIAVVSFLVLWSYAFVTGLPPSVLRAVGMFSFVAVAKPLGRTTSIINTLAASAFFLLMFDPYLILSAGFQLSYLAVLGIVLLYRPIYNLLEPKSALLNWTWQVVCVSLAAQLATLPVTLFYFHQFPVYFLFANLFVMPLATVILLGGIGLLVVSPIRVLVIWVGKGLSLLVSLLNHGLFEIARLPGSLYYPISLTVIQAFCLAGLIITGYLLFATRRFAWVMMSTVFAIVFFAEDHRSPGKSDASFVVYRVNRHTAVEWFDHGRSVVLMDSALAADGGMINYHIVPHRIFKKVRITQVSVLDPRRAPRLVVFQSTSVLLIPSAKFQADNPLKATFLVIGGNGVKSLETLSRTVTFEYVVLDSSNSTLYARQIAAEAARLGYRCHSVLSDGAFVANL